MFARGLKELFAHGLPLRAIHWRAFRHPRVTLSVLLLASAMVVWYFVPLHHGGATLSGPPPENEAEDNDHLNFAKDLGKLRAGGVEQHEFQIRNSFGETLYLQ